MNQRGMKLKDLKKLLIFTALAFLLLASATRYKNNLTLTYDGEKLTAQTPWDSLSVQIGTDEFYNITTSLQKSMIGESGLQSLSILEQDGTPIFTQNKFVIYLFGHDILGTMIKGRYPTFWRTFGDWTMDRFNSESFLIYNKTLPTKFKIHATFLGRGDKVLSFGSKSGNNVFMKIRDGFLDSDFTICAGSKCNGSITHESIFTNFTRIANFFIEGLLLAILVVILVSALSMIKIKSWKKPWKPNFGKCTIAMFIGILMIAHFSLALYFGTKILGGVPHIPDSAIYYEEAILISQGSLFLTNFTKEPVDAFIPLGGTVRNQTLYFDYNHFWPALMALPVKFGIANILNPFLSALSLLLVYLIGRRMYDSKVGCIAALIYCISPITIIMAGDYMMHTATQLFLLISIYCFLRYIDNPQATPAIIAGITLAYAFALRQLTTIGIAAPLLVYALIFYRKQIMKWKSLYFFLGLLPVLALFEIDNNYFRGGLFSLAHPAAQSTGQLLAEQLAAHFGFMYVKSTLGFVPQILFHSSFPWLTIALALVPLIILRKKEDYFLFAIFVSLVFIYALVPALGVHGYGPRYFFESFFAIFILISRAVVWILKSCKGFIRTLITLLFLGLFINNMIGLYTILPMYENYNGIHPDYIKELKKIDLPHSIILIPPFDYWRTRRYTATLWDPQYEKAVFINELPNDEHLKALDNYPNREIYRFEWNGIFPWSSNKSTAFTGDT